MNSEWLLYGLTALFGLWLVFHKCGDSKPVLPRLVECWYYDALGCRVDLGLFVKWDDDPISVLDAAVGKRAYRNGKYYWKLLEATDA